MAYIILTSAKSAKFYSGNDCVDKMVSCLVNIGTKTDAEYLHGRDSEVEQRRNVSTRTRCGKIAAKSGHSNAFAMRTPFANSHHDVD